MITKFTSYVLLLVRCLGSFTMLAGVENLMADDNQVFPHGPGLHDFQFQSSVGTMDLSLALPETISKGAPLVLVLHYAGQPTRYYGRPLLENLMLPAFEMIEDDAGAIFVAPTSLGGDWQTTNNTSAVLEVMKALENQYGTAPSRRVVSGYSMGAVGSWHLQSSISGFFAAAIPIAGYPTRSSVDCTTPTYAIMSDSDEIFPVKSFEELTEELQQKGCPITVEIISGSGHYDIGGFREAVSNAARWLRKQW